MCNVMNVIASCSPPSMIDKKTIDFIEEEAMDTDCASNGLAIGGAAPRSPAIATKNTTHSEAFPGKHSRPPHLQFNS